VTIDAFREDYLRKLPDIHDLGLSGEVRGREFPGLLDVARERARAFDLAAQIVKGHEKGIDTQAGMQTRLDRHSRFRHPLSGQRDFLVGGHLVTAYDWHRPAPEPPAGEHPPARLTVIDGGGSAGDGPARPRFRLIRGDGDHPGRITANEMPGLWAHGGEPDPVRVMTAVDRIADSLGDRRGFRVAGFEFHSADPADGGMLTVRPPRGEPLVYDVRPGHVPGGKVAFTDPPLPGSAVRRVTISWDIPADGAASDRLVRRGIGHEVAEDLSATRRSSGLRRLLPRSGQVDALTPDAEPGRRLSDHDHGHLKELRLQLRERAVAVPAEHAAIDAE